PSAPGVAREGGRVGIPAPSADDCAAVAKTLGPAAVPLAADLSRADEVRRLAAAVRDAMGARVDVLVNNAGQPRVAPSGERAEADYRYTIDLKLTAYFLLSQAIATDILERRRGPLSNDGCNNGSVTIRQWLTIGR